MDRFFRAHLPLVRSLPPLRGLVASVLVREPHPFKARDGALTSHPPNAACSSLFSPLALCCFFCQQAAIEAVSLVPANESLSPNDALAQAVQKRPDGPALLVMHGAMGNLIRTNGDLSKVNRLFFCLSLCVDDVRACTTVHRSVQLLCDRCVGPLAIHQQQKARECRAPVNTTRFVTPCVLNDAPPLLHS